MKITELWKQYSLFQSHNVTAAPSLSSVKGIMSMCLKTGYTLTINMGYNKKIKRQKQIQHQLCCLQNTGKEFPLKQVNSHNGHIYD
jgi:hypothetical protein